MTLEPPVEEFYTPPNEIEPDRLTGEPQDLFNRLLARLHSETAVRTLLPARVAGASRWYGIAPSEREGRRLREELRCWLGPPVSTRRVEVRGSTDPIDQRVTGLVPDGRIIRVDVTPGWQTTARLNVAALADLWALAPERGIDQPRPVGRVLRQFYESLLAGDRNLAESSLDEIKARSLLNATNVRFLRVELLSSLGTPQEIRDDPMLREVTSLARPPAVTERLAEAANSLLINPVLEGQDGAGWTSVGQELEETWPGLVTHVEQITTAAAGRCLVLRELALAEPRMSILQQAKRSYPDDPVLGAVVPEQAERQPARPTSPAEMYSEGDYWSALAAAEAAAAPTRALAAVALAAGVNLGDSESAVRALAILDRIAPDDREQLLAMSVERAFYEQLLARRPHARVPMSWVDWLRGDWIDRPDLLAEWSRGWARTAHALAEDSAALAEEFLDSLHDTRRSRVRNGVPVFVDWLVADGMPASGVSLATTLFDILLSSEPGRIERQASLALLEEVLSLGCTVSEYEELISAVTQQLPLLGPRDAIWLAQCVDLFLLESSPEPSKRLSLVADAAGVVTSWADRIEAADAAVLAFLFADAGVPVALPAVESASTEEKVSPARRLRVVGIYSLLESATRVASSWIERLFPEVEIRVSSEHVNSPSLESLVRAADVMLVQTSHAKHAATQAITAASPDPSRLVLVHGRGASALVRALLGWVGDSDSL